ncbi:MAG: hypothetical protein J2P28_24250 [Actinobacteria bacterium]|nr:hypothetical protein [Actinomycetota bacterium]
MERPAHPGLSGIIAGVSDAGTETDGGVDYPDVRQHLAELPARGEPSLDEVDWGRFHHAYGPADDVPDLLRALSARNPQSAIGQPVHLVEQGAS